MARDVLITPASGLVDFLDSSVSKASMTLGTDGILTINNIENSAIKIYTQSTQTNGITILGDGNVGIGTTNPECKLDIHDHTSATTFIADNNAGVRITNWGGDTGWSLLGFGGYSSIYTKNLSQIGSLSTNAGTYLAFGTSNNYGTGITNQAMTIDPSGNVGIGTTNPDSSLMVYKSAADSIIHVRGASNGADARVRINGYNSSELYIDRNGSGRFAFRRTTGTDDLSLLKLNNDYTDNSTIMFWDYSSGNVGIGGTPNSSYKLDIAGDTLIQDSESGDLRLLVNNISTSTLARTAISLTNNTGSLAGLTLPSTNYTGITNWANRLIVNTDSGISNGILVRPATGGFTVSTTGLANNDLRVDTSGNVGIGTDVPDGNLEIWESAVDTAASLRLTGDPDAGANTEYANIIFHSRDSSTGANGGEAQIRAYRGGDRDAPYLNFDLADAVGVLQQVMTINGNVGIGTTSPSEKLEISIGNVFVNGNNGQGIKLGSTNGIFRQASNELGFNTNNSERMRIDNIGNVGIGTTSPSYELQVSTSSNSRITASNTGYGVVNHLQADSTGGWVGTLSNHPLIIKTNNTEKVRVTTAGNVGIGTTSPQGKLDINTETAEPTHVYINGEVNQNKLLYFRHYANSEAAANNVALGYIGSNGIDNLLSLGHLNSSGTDVPIMHLTEAGNVGIGTTSPSEKLVISIGNVFVNGNNGQGIKLGSTNGIFRQASNELGFNTNNSEQMRIDNIGNVGIGTTNPAEKLEIQKNGNYQLKLTNGSIGGGNVRIAYADNSFGSGGSKVIFDLDNGGSANAEFVIQSNGNVGIGTTSPSAKLTTVGITGTTIIQALGADSSGFADVEIKSTGTTGASRLFFSDTAAQSGFIKYNHSDNSMQFGTSASVAAEITSAAEVGVGGAATASRTLTINSVNSASRPAVKVVNPNLDLSTASDGRTFVGWMPIDLDGTTRWIQVYV